MPRLDYIWHGESCLMIKRYSFKGDAYTLHFRDSTLCGGRIEIRISKNDLNDIIGCPVFLPVTLSVDQACGVLNTNNSGIA